MSLSSKQRHGGFTLVELVLALVLSGAFLALIAPAIRFAIKQPEQARVYTEASHKALLVSESIERGIKSAAAVSVTANMRCISMAQAAVSRSYCFDNEGLYLSEYGKDSKLLVDAVQGRFQLKSVNHSVADHMSASDSFTESVSRELVDLQFTLIAGTPLSFSRLILLPEKEEAP